MEGEIQIAEAHQSLGLVFSTHTNFPSFGEDTQVNYDYYFL